MAEKPNSRGLGRGLQAEAVEGGLVVTGRVPASGVAGEATPSGVVCDAARQVLAASAGAPPDNRGCLSSNPGSRATGLDKLETYAVGRLTSESLDTLARISEIVDRAGDSKENRVGEINGVKVEVGAWWGPKGKHVGATTMVALLHFPTFKVELAKHVTYPKTFPRQGYIARLFFDVFALNESDPLDLVDEAHRTLAALGYVADSDAIYRVDVKQDVMGKMAIVDELIDGKCWVGSVMSDEVIRQGQPATTIYVGRAESGQQLCIYSKVREIRDKAMGGPDNAAVAMRKLELLASQLGVSPESIVLQSDAVARIEWRFLGTWLRGRYRDCKSVRETLAALPGIIRELMHNRFRLTVGANKRDHNQSKLKTHPAWLAIAEGFAGPYAGCGVGPVAKAKRKEHEPMAQNAFLRKAFNDLVAARALEPGQPTDEAEFLAWITHVMYAYVGGAPEAVRAVQEKYRRRGLLSLEDIYCSCNEAMEPGEVQRMDVGRSPVPF